MSLHKIHAVYILTRYLLRFFDCLEHPNLSATLATDQKSHLLISYQSAIYHSTVCNRGDTILCSQRAPANKNTIVLILIISTMVNGTLLNFGNENDLRVIFDQGSKLHLGLDALSNQKILNGV